MTDFPDFQEPQANATALAGTNLVGTGLARESGGNLDTHTKLLNGTQAGALIANTGLTVGQETAALIASGSSTGTPGGAPLLHGARHLLGVSGQVIAAGGTFAPGLVTFTRPGYVIRFTANGGAGTSASPYLKCDLEWQVAAQGNVDGWEEIWYANIGTSSNHRTTGIGRVIGDTLKLTFTNGDGVKTCTLSLDIWEITHAPGRSDWRDTGGVTSGSGGTQTAQALANVLEDVNASIPASNNSQFNMPLYAGQVNLSINQNSHAGSLVTIIPVGAFDLTNQNAVITMDWTKGPGTYQGIVLPRCPCQLSAQNTNTVAAPFLASIQALEYAS